MFPTHLILFRFCGAKMHMNARKFRLHNCGVCSLCVTSFSVFRGVKVHMTAQNCGVCSQRVAFFSCRYGLMTHVHVQISVSFDCLALISQTKYYFPSIISQTKYSDVKGDRGSLGEVACSKGTRCRRWGEERGGIKHIDS
jgi:hypothetical protein